MNERQQDRQRGQDQHQSRERRGPSAIEWLIGAISTVLVLSAIGFLAYQARSGISLPPTVSVRADRILETPGGYLVEITAANTGGTTAQGLTIEGQLVETESGRAGVQQSSGTVVETSSATFQWIPAKAERRGGLFFSRNPLDYKLELQPKGYQQP